ncbi:MAG: right-handed parallel beta-helix repeat-containing protein, partial [Pirellulaceae bacterium]
MRVLHLEALEQRRMLSLAVELGHDAMDGPLGTESSPAPSVAIDLQADSDSGASCSDDITNVRTPTYDVRVNKPGTLEIDWEDDGTVDISETVTESGVHEYAPAAPLADGTYPVMVEFTDDEGTVATAENPTTIDTLGPTVVGVTPSETVTDPVSELTINYHDATALWEDTIVNRGNYALHSAGGDGTFDDGNEISRSARFADIAYDPDSQSAVISLHFEIGGDHFRLTLDGTSSIRDVAGNALDGDGDSTPGGDFVHTFEVTAPTLSRDIYVDDVTDPFEVGTREHPFDTFQEAIDLARDGDFIIALDGTYTGAGNRDVQLHGKAIVVQSVNPDDSNIVENTVIDCQASANDHHRAFWIHQGENADTVIAGLKITGGHARDGGALYLNGVNPTIEKNLFVNNHAESGGAIRVVNSTVTIAKTFFIGNSASRDGGAIHADSTGTGTVSLVDSRFVDNTAASDAGGVHLSDYERTTINGCHFLNNEASRDGGAVRLWENTANTIVESQFHENVTAGGDGGAIRAQGGSNIELFHNEFTDNVAGDDCGAAQMTDYEEVDVIDCTFLRNTATHDDGGALGIHNSSEPVQLSGNTFEQNSADSNGGAVLVINSTVSITNSSFTGNLASGDGGAIHADSTGTGTVSLVDSRFVGNTAASDAGGVHLQDYEQITINGCHFLKNEASRDGGAARLWANTTSVINGSHFKENSTKYNGGAIRVVNGALQVAQTRFTENSANWNGAAIFADGTGKDTASLTGSGFIDNKASDAGGVHLEQYNEIMVNGCSFLRNEASRDDGGAIYAEGTGTSTVSLVDSRFVENIAAESTGAVRMHDHKAVEIDGCDFLRNQASDHGGAVDVWDNGSFTLSNSTLIANEARWGGAVKLAREDDAIIGPFNVFDGNSAQDGAAVKAYRGDLRFFENTVTDNTASRYGGAVHGDNGRVVLANNLIERNEAGKIGGAVNLGGCNSSLIQDNVLVANSAESSGGAVDAYRTDVEIIGNTIRGNSASSGGGISLRNQCEATIEDNTIEKNVAETGNGGGIRIEDDSTARILENRFKENVCEVGHGAGISSNDSWNLIQRNVFLNNVSAEHGSAVHARFCSPWIFNNVMYSDPAHPQVQPTTAQVYANERSSPLLVNNIIWGWSAGPPEVSIPSIVLGSHAHADVYYCDTNDGYGAGSHGNIDKVPKFVETSPGVEDFHLLPDSPCVDAGHPAFRDNDGTVSDLGAYGNALPQMDLTDMYVAAESSAPWDGTSDHPYAHVWEGIWAATSGATVHVAAGTYFENLAIWRDNIRLSGAGAELCTIDGGYHGGVIGVWHADGAEIGGLTIYNGFNRFGAGVRCESASATIHDNVLDSSRAYGGGGIGMNCSTVVLRNNVIQNNRIWFRGAGVHVGRHSHAEIEGNHILGNWSDYGRPCGGGAIAWAGGSTGFIKGNLIEDNSLPQRWAEGDGGALAIRGNPLIADNVIRNNMAYDNGGAIWCQHRSSPEIVNNVIVGNSSGNNGGAIHCDIEATPIIRNNTIADNVAESAGGAGYFRSGSSATLENNIFWNNTAPIGAELYLTDNATVDVNHSDVQGDLAGTFVENGGTLQWGHSNIDVDPLFADPDSGDYHLRSVAGRWDADARNAAGEDTGAWVLDGEHSPCIDRGGPDTEEPFDWEAEPLPNGERINMGAYGGTAEASKSATVPHVVDVWPAPGSSVETGVPHVTLTFDLAMEPATLWSEHFALVGAGGDGHFGDGDEVEWPIEEVVWDAETNTAMLVLDLGCGAYLPRDTYRLTALDALRSEAGRRLDGEYDPATYPPSGDGWAGGSFLVTFDVPNAPPRAFADHATVEQDTSSTALPMLTGCDADGDAITFEINGTPWTEPGQTIPTEHGTLTAGADSAHWSYEPDPGFSGHDAFTFRAYDGFNAAEHESLSAAVQFDLLVAPQPCDLKPIDLALNDPPANLHMGHTVTAEWTVINHGPAATALAPEAWNHWLDSLYLSADAILDPDTDELLHVEEIDVAALAANDTYQVSAEVTLPANLEWSGDYYLIVETNSNRMQWETDTANNVLAEPVVLHPYVELVRPYCGQFTDNRTHLEFVWIDIDRQHDASINLAVDDDDDPSNGTPYEWLAEGLPEDPDGTGDTHQVLLPDLTPRVEPYYVWAQIDNGSEIQHSEPVAIRVFEAAYYSDDELGDAIGGWGYETLGIEAGLLDNTVYYRVLTNYPPTQSDPLMPPLEGKGGDVYVNVGGRWQDGDGVVHGIAVNQSSDYRAPELANGDLYTEAEFGTGVVVSSRPTFIVDWVDQLSDRSSAVVAAPACLPWDYVIDGHFELGALPDYADESIQIAWSMYCGNDITDVIIPGRDTLRVVDMAPTPSCLCPELVNDVGEVVLWFNRQDVDPASVNTDTLQVFDVGVDGRYGTPDDVEVPAESVVYDAQTWTATWTPASPLAAGHTYAVRLADRGLDGALTFDGEDDFVDTGLNINQGATSNGITFEAWVRPESTSSGKHQVLSTDNGGFDWSMLRQGGTWRVSTGEGSRSTGMSVDVGVWQHIAAVFEPEVGVTFYKNGQPALVPHLATDESDSPLAIGATPGGFHGGQHFDGTIDELRVWNTPRTGAEIRQQMYRALDGTELGLLGYWDFEEGTGQVAYDAGPLDFHAILGDSLDPDDADPTWSDLGAPVAGVTDLDGRPLDGEFACQFPSGNGQDGGEFVARFMVGEDYPNVIAMDPAPGELVDAATGMNRVHVTFDAPLEPATLYPLNFELIGAGGDEDFTDGDEVAWPITDVDWNAATYTATLTTDPPCAYLPRDLYRVVASDTLQTPCGLHLDGEFPAGGTATDLPSGDGQPGGDFVAEFEVLNAPPLAHHGFTTATQGAEIPLQPLTGCDADGDALTFSIVTPPRHGTLQAGTDSAHWIYEPDDPEVVQDDWFEFRAFDNHDAESDVAYSPSQRYDILMTADACDLQPTSLVVDGPDHFHLGDTVTVSWAGINNGPGTTVDHGDVDWRETFYLSETPDLSGDYIEISQVPVNRSPLASEETYEESGRSLLLPDHVEWSGAYYLVLEVNSRASDQVESDRSNNVVATAIELDPYIELLTMCDSPLPVAEMTTLYDGQFVDTGSPLTFAWTDVDQQHSATVDLYIDDGAGQRWPIMTGIAEDPEDAGDTVTASLPVDVPPRLAHYDVYAELVSPAGTFRSNAVPVHVFDRAYVKLDPLDDPVGGVEYQVHGIEAGVLDGLIYYRVRTDYDPASNGSGDLYINVGGSWEDRYQDADGTWQDGSG